MNTFKRTLLATALALLALPVMADPAHPKIGFSIDDLLSQNRTADLATAIQIAMYLSREKTEESLQQIGRAFNKKDHTTVIHACRKIEELLKTDMRMKNFVENIVSKL